MKTKTTLPTELEQLIKDLEPKKDPIPYSRIKNTLIKAIEEIEKTRFDLAMALREKDEATEALNQTKGI